MRYLAISLLAFAPFAMASCASRAGDAESIGRATVAITKAPADVACIRLTVAGASTLSRSLDIVAGQSTVFALTSLPLGQATFSADAFPQPCAAVDASAVADWSSDPVIATIASAPAVVVSLAMHRTGQANVGVDFPDDDGGIGVGEGGNAPEDYALSISPALVATTLGTQSHYTLTLASSYFAGPVTLAASGLPADWTATFTPSSVVLPADGTVTVDLNVAVPTATVGVSATLRVDATATPGVRSASAALTVANEYDVFIADGTGTGDHKFPVAVTLKAGATLRFVDQDTTTLHEIHSDGTSLGLPHQPGTMSAGQSYAGTLTGEGMFSTYCHLHGSPLTPTTITVVP